MKASSASSSAGRPPTSVVRYFQVHQPFRLRHFTILDIGAGGGWFDDAENERIARRVAERCYRPTTAILLEQIERCEGRFRCAFSVSGTALDQMERWAPEALESFVKLARTITEQRPGIEAAIEHELSNARVEAINTKIRLITRRAFGFHSSHALIALAMLTLSGLCPPLPGR